MRAVTCRPSRSSHTYLNNRNLKYRDNDDSSEENLDPAAAFRGAENHAAALKTAGYLGRWTVREGAELSYSSYTNRTVPAAFHR